jgi:hypothetical protein
MSRPARRDATPRSIAPSPPSDLDDLGARTRARSGRAGGVSAVVTMRVERDRSGRPSAASWFASVPPDVKTTPSGSIPQYEATAVRASSICRRAARPGGWREDGFAHAVSRASAIAATTLGWGRVVAALSK